MVFHCVQIPHGTLTRLNTLTEVIAISTSITYLKCLNIYHSGLYTCYLLVTADRLVATCI